MVYSLSTPLHREANVLIRTGTQSPKQMYMYSCLFVIAGSYLSTFYILLMVINISMLFFHFLCLPIHGLLCVRLFLKQRELSVEFSIGMIGKLKSSQLSSRKRMIKLLNYQRKVMIDIKIVILYRLPIMHVYPCLTIA